MVEGGRSTHSGFHAFISYSHAADGRLAPALRTGLEQLAKPWLRRRALRVFHDSTGLGASPGLWSTITAALDQTRFFILLASPESAASRWVQQEIDHFLSLQGGAHRLLIVVSGGEIFWDDSARDFDWATTTALSTTLAGVFTEEPLYIDLRWARTADQLDLHNARFRQAVADLAAPLHGVARDEIDARDLREFRRARRARRTAVAAISALAVLATVAALMAVRNAATARREADASEAGRLAALSNTLLEDRTDQAMLLARYSLRISPSREGEMALARAVTQPAVGTAFVPGTATPGGGLVLQGRGTVLDLDGSGTQAALWTDEEVLIWRVDDPAQRRSVAVPGTSLRRIDLAADGSRLALVDTIADVAWVEDVDSGGSSQRWPAVDALLTPDGLVTVTRDGVVEHRAGSALLWRTRLGTLGDETLALSGDGRFLAVAADRYSINFLDTATGAVLWDVDIVDRSANVIAVSPDGGKLAFGGARDEVTVLTTERGSLTRTVTGLPAWTNALAFTTAGDGLIIGGYDGAIRLADLGPARPTGTMQTETLPGHDDAVNGVAVSTDGRWLYSSSTDGARRWDLRSGRPAAELFDEQDEVDYSGVAVTPDGETYAAVTVDRVDLWQHAGRKPYVSLDAGASAVFVSSDLLAAVNTATDSVDLFDVADGRRIGSLPGGDLFDELFATADGRLVVVGRSGEVRMWDPSTQELTRRVQVGSGSVRDVAVDGRADLVAVALPEGVEVHDGESGRLLSNWAPSDIDQREFHTFRVAFRPDGGELAIGQPNGTVVRIDPRTGVVLGEFRAQFDEVRALAYSSDGRWLATAGDTDNSGTAPELRLWDPETGQLVVRRVGHDDRISDVAFSHDGRWLVSTGEDGRLMIWSAAARWAEDACELAGRDLTQEERQQFLRPADRSRQVC